MKNKKSKLTAVLHQKQIKQIELRRLIKEKAQIRKEIVRLEGIEQELESNNTYKIKSRSRKG